MKIPTMKKRFWIGLGLTIFVGQWCFFIFNFPNWPIFEGFKDVDQRNLGVLIGAGSLASTLDFVSKWRELIRAINQQRDTSKDWDAKTEVKKYLDNR